MIRSADKKSTIHDYWHRQAKLFSKLYRSWNPLLLANRLFLARRQSIVQSMMETMPGNRALDVGCGSGEFLELLEPNYETVFGCDYSELMLGVAMSQLKSPNIHLFHADALRLPIKDEQIDHLYALGLFDYVDDVKQGLSECFRMVKDGGYAVVTFPKSPSLFEPLRWSQFIRKALFQIPPILNVYSKRSLYSELGEAGFVIDEIRSLWTTMWIAKVKKRV